MFWHLILIIKMGYAGGMTEIEMQSYEACHKAATAWEEKARGDTQHKAYCVDSRTGELK